MAAYEDKVKESPQNCLITIIIKGLTIPKLKVVRRAPIMTRGNRRPDRQSISEVNKSQQHTKVGHKHNFEKLENYETEKQRNY